MKHETYDDSKYFAFLDEAQKKGVDFTAFPSVLGGEFEELSYEEAGEIAYRWREARGNKQQD